MKLKVSEVTERPGVGIESGSAVFKLETGDRFPVGFGNIVVCDDGVVLIFSSELIEVETAPGKRESMVTLNGKPLEGDIRQPFCVGDRVTLVVPEQVDGGISIFRQTAERV